MKIRIGGIDYPVCLVDRLQDETGTRTLSGHITYGVPMIKLDTGLDSQMIYQTLWHEVLHGILTTYGIELEETQVDIIAHGIVQVLRDSNKTISDLFPKGWLK